MLYIAENRQLTDIVFQIEKSRKFADQIKSVVFRSRLGASKDFAFYLNEFFKECVNLENTNLGELMRSSKNVNVFRDLKGTKLQYVNAAQTDLKNNLVERMVLALKPCKTMQKINVAENPELELQQMQNLFRLKKIRVNVQDDFIITFPV